MAKDAIEQSGKAEAAAANASTNDPFAEYRAPVFNAPAEGQGSKFVEWQMDLGKCSQLMHSMWLTGSGATIADKSNENIQVGPTAISRMTQADVNKCGEKMTGSYYAEKDAAGNVSKIGYKDSPNWDLMKKHPIASLLLAPDYLIGGVIQEVKNKMTDDVSIKFKDGHALYSIPWKYNIQDGSNTVKVKLKSDK